MNLTTFLTQSIESLKRAGTDNPQLDARLLACHALGVTRAELLSQSQRALTTDEEKKITALIARRATHEPVARIIGNREFWGLEFRLNEATLEPRPDSETLIEAVLAGGQRSGVRGQERSRILDLGTGTGCLLLALLHALPNATGVGIDINPRAVEQAAENAVALGMEKRASFIVSNWLDNVVEKFDIIISNPPYIPNPDIPTLMPEVRDYDPILALDGGEDGLVPYRILIPRLKNFLNPDGMACFEIGVTQAAQVVELFAQSGFQNIVTHKDLGGIERCVTAFLRPNMQ